MVSVFFMLIEVEDDNNRSFIFHLECYERTMQSLANFVNNTCLTKTTEEFCLSTNLCHSYVRCAKAWTVDYQLLIT